ncbi:o-Glycosyl hydrolase family 30 [Sesbania bispinosa]|nr:o-Glycosyl hydrolase family 30 [Sesbania bispinosa]
MREVNSTVRDNPSIDESTEIVDEALTITDAREGSPTPSGVAAPVSELTDQEQDLLDRSTKKPKVVDKGDSPLVADAQQGVEVVQPNVTTANDINLGQNLFETTIGMGMERKMISYKDICVGVNGHNVSEEDVISLRRKLAIEEMQQRGIMIYQMVSWEIPYVR